MFEVSKVVVNGFKLFEVYKHVVNDFKSSFI